MNEKEIADEIYEIWSEIAKDLDDVEVKQF